MLRAALLQINEQMAFVSSRLATGSKGGLAATMEAAKEKESAFRKRFEATAGESGARAAVLAYRPAVREAAQRNTAPPPSAEDASAASSTAAPPSSTALPPPIALRAAGGGLSGGAPREHEFGGKPWAQLSWSARLAACRGVEDAAKVGHLVAGHVVLGSLAVASVASGVGGWVWESRF